MIIADIIKEMTDVKTGDLLKAIYGLRDAYRVFPATLKKEMLGEYSNTEYALLSALRNNGGVLSEDDNPTIYDIYRDSQQ